MSDVWFIGDTHFGHSRILEFEPGARPFSSIEEHDEHLVRAWNETVGLNDIVWHLGDVIFPRHAIQYVARLNGRKRLILGNHDNWKLELLMPFFEKIAGCAYIDRIWVLTHIPVRMPDMRGNDSDDGGGGKIRGRLNIHGHLHSKTTGDPRHINVSVEHTGLRPINFDEIQAQCRANGVLK